MTEENGAAERNAEKPAIASHIKLNYILIALTFTLVGVLIAGQVMKPAEDTVVTVDEAQLRAVILSVLDEHDFGAAAVEEGPDRFAFVDDDPYLGEEDAPIVIVEFSDFFCGYCKRHFDLTFAPLLENYGEYIRYVYRDFARLTEESPKASAAAQCAFEQGKFWEIRSEFFENQGSLGRDFYIETAEEYGLDVEEYTACVEEDRYLDEVELDGFDGQIAGVRGTPAFFVNGQILSGAQPYSIFERMIQRELDKAGIEYRVSPTVADG